MAVFKDKFHQSSNGIGKWTEVHENALDTLSRAVDVETTVDCIDQSPKKSPKVVGFSVELFCQRMAEERGEE